MHVHSEGGSISWTKLRAEYSWKRIKLLHKDFEYFDIYVYIISMNSFLYIIAEGILILARSLQCTL